MKNKFLFSFVVLSFIIACFLCFFFAQFENTFIFLLSLVFFIPVIIVYALYLLANKIGKCSFLTKMLIAVINVAIIFFVQICFTGFVMLVVSAFNTDSDEGPKTDIKYYKNFESHVMEKDKVAHFPNEIPKEAANFIYYNESGRSEGVYIAFDIDKKYIENELKKHKFVKIEGPYKDYGGYNMDFTHAMRHLNEKPDGYKVYYLTIRHRGDDETHHFPAINGIATKGNRIVYFYGSLD